MTSWKRFLSCIAMMLVAGCLFGAEPAASAPAQTEAEKAGKKFTLQRIVLIESPEAAEKPIPPGDDFVLTTAALKAINAKELTERLIMGKGRAIDQELLGKIVQVVAIYIRQNDFPVADIIIPQQNINDGTLRLVVMLGKLRTVKTTGNRWFSESVLQTRLGVAQGDTIRLSQLERSIDWANNTNPFRQLKLRLDPIPNSGEFDLIIGVEERLPLRLVAAYDNTGNEILGNDRYTAAITYGNMFGREQQLTYQFITTREPKFFKAHSVNYSVPLKWRHVIQTSLTHVNVSSTFLDGYFFQKGKSLSADSKYIIPFKTSRWQGEISANVGFRQTDNNLEFSGTPVIGAVTESLLVALAAAAFKDDTRGKWVTSLTLTGSPGKFNSRSGSRLYQDSRIGSDPVFGHIQALIQRSTLLTTGVVSNLRLVGQFASGNLLSNEQFSVGGSNTVRGYKERILSGDHGYLASHELQIRLPSVPLRKNLPKLDLVGVMFWDYGRTVYKNPLLGQAKSDHLASAGVGLRTGISNKFSASVDYARQLEEITIPGEPHHRVHVRATLSY